MRKKHPLLWLTLILFALNGCVRAVHDEPTPTSAAQAAPTPTPIVVFDESPATTPTTSTTSAFPPTLYLEPSAFDLAVGQTKTVNIWIDEAQRVNSVLVELSFDPTYVQVEDAEPDAEGVQIAPGEMPDPVEITRNEVTADDLGRIIYEVSQEAGTGASGGGIVASIVLRGVQEGRSPLSFESVAAYSPDGESLAATSLSDGLFTIVSGDTTPTPTEAPTTDATTATPQEATPAPTADPTSAPATPCTPAPSGGRGIYYVVQPDENLFRIGLKFGTTADAIAAASSIPDADRVEGGEMVLVPVAPPQGDYGYYVQHRDTVYSIARRFGMTVDQLTSLNGIGADYHIEPGQILIVTP